MTLLGARKVMLYKANADDEAGMEVTASIQPGKGYIEDVRVPIEEDDVVEYVDPRGVTMRLLVTKVFVREGSLSNIEFDWVKTTKDRSSGPRKGNTQRTSAAVDEFEYQVALSFAGEDRQYAEAVANGLAIHGITVFYDAFEEADLWGKDLYTHLHEIYSERARYCVLFASQQYAKKLWTTHERKAAQERAFKEKGGEYILPVRIDETPIPGLTETTGYISISKGTDHIIESLLTKLGSNTIKKN